MQPHAAVLLSAVALGFVAPSIGQEALPSPNRIAQPAKRTTEGATTSKAPFVFEAGETPLLTLVSRCSNYLQYNILIDGTAFQAMARNRAGGARKRAGAAAAKAQVADDGPLVHLQRPVVTDHNGCEDLLSSILWAHGLALVALDEDKAVYEVLAMDGQRARETLSSAVQRTPEQILARPMLRTFVRTAYRLKHTNALLANNSLRPLYSSNSGSLNGLNSVQFGNAGNTTSLILAGPNFMVASALKLLQAADVPEAAISARMEARFQKLTEQNTKLMQRLQALERRVSEGR